LLRPTALRALIAHAIPYRELSHSVIPCHVVTTDVMSGEEVLHSDGDVIEALLASTAIPAIFPPVALDGRLLMDGAVGNIAPLSTAIALGANRVIVLPTGFSCAATAPPTGALSMAVHSVSLVAMRQLHADICRVNNGTTRVAVVPPLCPLNISAYDFSHAATLIAQSHLATREWLASKGLERDDVPMALLPHGHTMSHAES
jgi:NTE family protein